MRINDVKEAAFHFMRNLCTRGAQIEGRSANWSVCVSDRHPLDPKKTALHFVFLKRDPYWFLSFGRQFPYLPEEYKGYGQTVTLSTLTTAAKSDGTIIIVLDDGRIYGQRAKHWYEFATRYNTIRKASNAAAPDELEASVPIKMLERLFPLEATA